MCKFLVVLSLTLCLFHLISWKSFIIGTWSALSLFKFCFLFPVPCNHGLNPDFFFFFLSLCEEPLHNTVRCASLFNQHLLMDGHLVCSDLLILNCSKQPCEYTTVLRIYLREEFLVVGLLSQKENGFEMLVDITRLGSTPLCDCFYLPPAMRETAGCPQPRGRGTPASFRTSDSPMGQN